MCSKNSEKEEYTVSVVKDYVNRMTNLYVIIL